MKKTFIRIAWALAFALPALTFTACNDDDPEPIVLSDEADILTVEFKDQTVIQSGPTRDGEATPTRFVFYVRHDADDDIKALVPTIEISEGATISPKSGVPQDFNAKSSIRYTVTAEDGVTKVDYDIVCERIANDEKHVVSVTIKETELVSKQPEFVEGATSATFTLIAGADKTSITPEFIVKAASIDPASGLPQDFTSGSITYTLKADDGTDATFTLNCEQELFEGAVIEEMAIDSELVTVQVTGSGGELYFAVGEDTTNEQIAALSLDTFVISGGAVATIGAGDHKVTVIEGYTPGFVLGEPIHINIKSENGVDENDYTITCYKAKYYDFEDWYETSGYPMERSWWNANAGISMAMSMGLGIQYPTHSTETTPSNSGKAAELKTYRTAITSTSSNLPGLVAGNMYLGGFYFPISDYLAGKNVLTGTKFGIPFEVQPMKVIGTYKYTPGSSSDFWHDKTADPGKNDSYAMTAILYEVENYGTYENGEYKTTGNIIKKYECGDILTGVDLAGDIKDNPVVIAFTQKTDTAATTDFEKFELALNYQQEYSVNKKYKFAMIFSSSKDGASYMGAHDSTLILDDIYVLYK